MGLPRNILGTMSRSFKVPKKVEDALDIDCKTGTYFCEKSIRKEMTNVRIAFNNIDVVTS